MCIVRATSAKVDTGEERNAIVGTLMSEDIADLVLLSPALVIDAGQVTGRHPGQVLKRAVAAR